MGVELLIGAAVAVISLVVLWALAPTLGAPTAEPRTKGLSALQTIFGLLGILLIAGWYLVEQPDAARLKFDQTVTGARLEDGRALVTIEVSITNVGGHADHFDKLPYKIFVQRTVPLPDYLLPSAMAPPNGIGRVWRADNWETLAYRAVGTAASKDYPNWEKCSGSDVEQACDDGLETVIEPGENENLYFAAVVPCAKGLHVAVSSRFPRPPGPWEELRRKEPEVWIKQSFLDLTEVCAANKGQKKGRANESN
jgi:hypothetical protein